MRVIAGTARGVPLAAPKGFATRPTAGRLRENLFNILSPQIKDAHFLDLFSGSGAVGIEALSRGAERAVLVEQAYQAAAVIKTNLAKTKLAGKAEIMTMPVSRALALLAKEERRFDIIFMDPPYAGEYVNETVIQLGAAGLLAPGGLLAAELPAEDLPLENPAFEVWRVKVYGDKKFILWTGMDGL